MQYLQHAARRAFCLHEKQFTVVTFITGRHPEARGAFLLSSVGSVQLISVVSGDLQHQTAVTQASLWFLYVPFMFAFSQIHFPGKMPG